MKTGYVRRLGPGPDPVRPQGLVHQAAGPGPYLHGAGPTISGPDRTADSLLTPASIPESFPSTRRFENELGQSEMSSFPTTLNSPTSKSPTSIRLGWQPVQKGQR